MSETSKPDAGFGGLDDQAAQEEAMRQLREELAAAPVGDVVAQAAAHLATFAYVRLGLPPEQNQRFRDLDAARVLIDAFGGLIDGARGRLGQGETELRQVLAELRMTYARMASAEELPEAGEDAGAERPAPPEEQPGLHRPSGLWVPGQD